MYLKKKERKAILYRELCKFNCFHFKTFSFNSGIFSINFIQLRNKKLTFVWTIQVEDGIENKNLYNHISISTN